MFRIQQLNSSTGEEELESSEPIASVKLWYDSSLNKGCIMLETKDEIRFIYSDFAGKFNEIKKIDLSNHVLVEDEMHGLGKPKFDIRFFSEPYKGATESKLGETFESDGYLNEKVMGNS